VRWKPAGAVRWATADAVRRIMVEGPSGILATAPPWCRPSYEVSTRRLVYPNGGIVHMFNAEEPDRLLGPNLDGVWADAFPNGRNVAIQAAGGRGVARGVYRASAAHASITALSLAVAPGASGRIG
jgi:phage terminase large subunit-like protein